MRGCGLLRPLLNYVNGTLFELPVMIQLMAMLIVGGIGTRWGSIVGALLVTWVSQGLGRYADYSLLIFGVLYGAAVLLLPRGLCGVFGTSAPSARAPAVEPAEPAGASAPERIS